MYYDLRDVEKMIFGDWKTHDQTPVPLELHKGCMHYLHSRAWSVKGYLGGTHSWFVFWSEMHDKHLVDELTDMETIYVQRANAIFVKKDVGYIERTPVISDRAPNSRWFGSIPVIVGKTEMSMTYHDIEQACIDYPITQFNLLNRNCNTFSSYLIHRFGLKIRRPLRSIGFKGKKFWNRMVDGK